MISSNEAAPEWLTCSTKVGDVYLPDLPPGWLVVFDTETSGLFVDGDPGTKTQPAAPPARVSIVSIAFRVPNADGTPGPLVSHAWAFDQGPVVGKPGRPVRDPDTLRQSFPIIDEEAQAKILSKFVVAVDTVTGQLLRDRDGFAIWAAIGGTKKNPTYEGPAADLLYGGKAKAVPMSADIAFLEANESPEDYGRLIRWLSERDVIGGHNLKFDLHIKRAGLRANAGGLGMNEEHAHAFDFEGTLVDGRRRYLYDTMLAQGLLEPLDTSALKPTMRRLYGDDETEEQRMLQVGLKALGVGLGKRYDLLPWPVIGPYAAKDASQTHRLEERQEHCVREGAIPPQYEELLEGEFNLMRVLYRMECRGVRYEKDRSLAASAQLMDRAREIAKTLPYNPSKPMEVKKFYFGKPEEGGLGLIPTEVTPAKGDPKLDEAEVRRLVDVEGAPFAKEYDEYSHILSAIAKWYDGWGLKTGPDGRLRTNFRQGRIESDRPGQKSGGAISGRLSVERFQAQAIPHDHQLPHGAPSVRGLITEDDEFDLWETDLPQGEVRIATAVAQCWPMFHVLESGEDVHGATATLVFGVNPGDEKYKELRGVAKRLTFGVLYGAGVMTLKDQIRIFTGVDYSLAETKEFHDKYHNTFPEFRKASRIAEQKVNRGVGGPGFVRLINGRRRWYGWAEKTTSAFNQVIQGSLAVTCNRWMIEVERQYPGCLLLQIHDSLVYRTPKGPEGRRMAEGIAALGQQIFEETFNLRGMAVKFPMEPELWSSKS